MTNTADEIVNIVEGSVKKTRSKSNVYFYGVKDNQVTEIEMVGGVWNAVEATSQVTKKLGDGAQVLGPFYKVKSGKNKILVEKTEIQVRLDLMQLNFTHATYTGNHNNWVFTAKGIAACAVDGESFNDNDLVFIEYTGLFDDSIKTRKPRNGGRIVVRKERLDEVVEA